MSSSHLQYLDISIYHLRSSEKDNKVRINFNMWISKMESMSCMLDSKISILEMQILDRNHKYLRSFARIHSDMQKSIDAQRISTKELHRWDNLYLYFQNKYCKYYDIKSNLNPINISQLDKKHSIFCWS